MSETKVHPATAAWWSQRKTCAKCMHCKTTTGRAGEKVMRCLASNAQKGREGKKITLGPYCIDARGIDQPCGTHALLFKPKPVKD